jgi:PAS domain S-box-containing protein
MLTMLRAMFGRRPFSGRDPRRTGQGDIPRRSDDASVDRGEPRQRDALEGAPTYVGRAGADGRNLLQAIIDNSTAVIYVKDLDGRFLLINRRFEALFHVSRADIVGKTDHDLFPAERADAFRAFDQRVLAAGVPLESEEIAPHDDGLHTYISVKCPLRDASGVTYGICGISTDITERKRAEQALRVSTEKYRSLYDDTPVMMHSIDRDGRLLSVSNYWLEALGYERDEVIGRRSAEFLTPESRRFAHDVVLPEFFRTGRCKDVPYQFVKKNGDIIDVLLSATAERDDHGAIVRSLAVLTDVTERRRAEEMLHRMASIVQSTSDAAVSVTRERVVTSWNRGAEAVYGYSAEEMIGRPIIPLIPPHRADEARAVVERVLAGETIAEIETERVRKDGSIIPIDLTISPVIDTKGAIVGIASIARDASRRKEMESALRESEQRFRDFAEMESDWFWETGPDHRFTWLSERVQLYDLKADSRIGRRRWDYAADLETEPEKWREHRATLDRHEPFRDFVFAMDRGDGVLRFVSTSGKPIFDGDRRFKGYRGIGREVTAAVRASQALRAGEERFRDYAETASDWFWETGPDHAFTYVSQPHGAFALDTSARLGARRFDIAADREEEPEKWRRHLAALERHEPFRDFTYRVRRGPDGNVAVLSTSGKPMFDAHGQFLGYRGSARDITDTVEAAEALHASEERFRDFAETESDWFWETGPDHRVTWMSEQVGTTGFVIGRRIGRTRWEYAMDVAEEPEKWRQHRAQLDRREPFRDFIFKIHDEYGAECFVSTGGKPVFGSDGSFLGYRGVGRDVTDAVRAAQALRDSEERLELAVEAGRMGTWDYDVVRDVVQWSPQLAAMFGMPAEETSAGFAASLERIHPDDRDAVVNTLTAALKVDSRYRAEHRLATKGDGERWIDTRGIIVRDDAGQPVRMVGVVQEITERKQAEARQKLLLDELNHRVKNTLVAVQSMAMQMARSADSPGRFYEAFRARLLALSHAHDLLTRDAWQGASLRELLRQTLAAYVGSDERRAELSGPEVRLNPNVAVGLAMAFQELATNATKYGALSTPDGRIALSWSTGVPYPDAVEIRWRESGGPAVAQPRHRGFGSRLLERGLAHELRAEVRLDFAPAGLECRIRLPSGRS